MHMSSRLYQLLCRQTNDIRVLFVARRSVIPSVCLRRQTGRKSVALSQHFTVLPALRFVSKNSSLFLSSIKHKLRHQSHGPLFCFYVIWLWGKQTDHQHGHGHLQDAAEERLGPQLYVLMYMNFKCFALRLLYAWQSRNNELLLMHMSQRRSDVSLSLHSRSMMLNQRLSTRGHLDLLQFNLWMRLHVRNYMDVEKCIQKIRTHRFWNIPKQYENSFSAGRASFPTGFRSTNQLIEMNRNYV